MTIFTAKRLTHVVLVCFLTAACGSDRAARSDYFMVTFLPNLPAPSDAGIQALTNAARQAGRHTPSFIALDVATTERGDIPELAQQRIGAVTQAFVREGVNPGLIRTEPRVFDAKSFAARRDSIIVQLAYGK
jgi:hypothetical protein